jgi:RimJ/RimL family protein N-acetyltransferase
MLLPDPSKRLRFREWEEADTIPFAQMNLDPEVMAFFPSPLSVEETVAFVGRIKEDFEVYVYGLYVIEKVEKPGFIGFTGFSVVRFESFFTPCTEIGWRLNRKDWGKGYATEAARTCLEFGFSILGFNKICSFTSVLNTRSIRVMNRIGMTCMGEFEHPLVPKGNPLRTHSLYQILR